MKDRKRRRARRRGFTLMEILVVISIMVLLAGLTLGIMSYLSQKQPLEQAKVQIRLLETGLENYHAEHGEYPANAKWQGDMGTERIFRALFPNNANATVYLPQLNPQDDQLNWVDGNTILDPWGKEYRYRTNRKTGTTVICTNPGFDLWSCGPDGETEPGTGGNYDPRNPKNLDDVRSW